MVDLAASARSLLELPKEARALACMRDFWVEYPSAVKAKIKAQALISLPRGGYNPGMLVTGISGIGKSAMVKRWVKESWDDDSGWAGRLIYVDMSENIANLNVQSRLIEEIAIACGRPDVKTVAQAQRVIREFRVSGAVIDELAETEEATVVRRWKANLLSIRGIAGPRWALNLILLGIPIFAETVKTHPQLGPRFGKRQTKLDPWTVSYELAAFIKGCLRYMPLMQYSPITDVFLLNLIDQSLSVECTDKKFADSRSMLDLFKEACRGAVLAGKEYLDVDDLRVARERMGDVETSSHTDADITLEVPDPAPS
jgi:hypothetical protein